MDKESFNEKFRKLVETYRDTCLWFINESDLSSGDKSILRILEAIERYGDRNAFIEVRRLRRWLLQSSR